MQIENLGWLKFYIFPNSKRFIFFGVIVFLKLCMQLTFSFTVKFKWF